MNNFGNSSTIYGIQLRDFKNAKCAGIVEPSDFTNVIVRENRHRGVFSSGVSALARAITHIVQLGADKKVLRIHATSIVALVKHTKTIWNWAVMKLVGKAMRRTRLAVYMKVTVAVLPFRSHPHPAISKVRNMIGDWTVFAYFGPESRNWINGCSFTSHAEV